MAARKIKAMGKPGTTPPRNEIAAPQQGVVGARTGNYGKQNTRTTLATTNKRGTKLRGGQSAKQPYKGYKLP